MNKYNIQAIRIELEDHIRNWRWKRFRRRFQTLDTDLARAVAVHNNTSSSSKQKKLKHKNNKEQQQQQQQQQLSSSSLLLCHMLRWCRTIHDRSKPTLPIDVLEMVIRASPPNLHQTTSPTPLAIAMEHGASLAILETLLLSYDTTTDKATAALLCVSDKEHGDTPLLFAIRRDLGEDVVRLLIRSDPTRRSLLVGSKKRNCTPLFYVANRELDELYSQYYRNEIDEYVIDLPVDLQYMLYQTYLAIMDSNNHNNNDEDDDSSPAAAAAAAAGIKGGGGGSSTRNNTTTTTTTTTSAEELSLNLWKEETDDSNGFFRETIRRDEDYDDDDDDDESVDYDDQSSVDYSVGEKEHWTTLLEATIATAHLLGTKSTARLLAFLVPKTLAHYRNTIGDEADNNNNNNNNNNNIGMTLLHHVCRAAEEQSFLAPSIPAAGSSSSSSSDATSLVETLLEANPRAALSLSNDQGELPLHLALETNKSWELVRHVSSPEVVRVPNSNGSLPLHTAIVQYRGSGGSNATTTTATTTTTTTENIIMELWKMYPEAGTMVDGATRLFPFQLAAAAAASPTKSATSTTSRHRHQRKNNPHRQSCPNNDTATMTLSCVSNSYFLLRSAPQVLNQYVVSGNTNNSD
jgi:hypothetical protein